MKQILAILLLLGTSFFTPVLADDTHDEDYDIGLTETYGDDEENMDDRIKKGHRTAPMLTPCTISYVNGVTIFANSGPVEILSYEIWDADGETCLGVYVSERMFLDALYADKGDLIVVFNTTEKKYKGYIQFY